MLYYLLEKQKISLNDSYLTTIEQGMIFPLRGSKVNQLLLVQRAQQGQKALSCGN